MQVLAVVLILSRLLLEYDVMTVAFCTPSDTSFTAHRGKGKSVPLQARRGPEGSRKLRFPDYMTTAQDGGKVVSPMHRPPFTPRKCSWYSFLLEAESTPRS